MSSTNLDAYNLKSVNLDGLIHEDVMSKIWDISKIPLPFTERAGTGSHSNQYFSWRLDKLQDSVTTGQLIDGQVVTTEDNKTKNGRRVGTHSEIRGKRVEVSTRANEVNTIGYAKELANQIARRQMELRRDVESTCLSNNASVEGTDAVAGVTAGLAAWLTNVDVDGNAAAGNVHREAGGADGGWDATAADSLVAASTPGTVPVAISETNIRDVVQSIYEKGGEPNVLMTTPAVKRLISEYMFTDTARIATMTNESPGGSAPERKAQGSVDLFITDYGSLALIPNRLQKPYDTDNHSAYILDFKYLELSYLQGYRVEPLAKDALSSNRFMSVDWGLCVKNWDALGAVHDIDPAAAMVA
jgi:hypothetical protein